MGIVELLQGLSSAATSIIACFVVVGLVVVGTVFAIRRFREAERKSKGLSEADEDYRKAKKEDAQKLVPIDDIRDGMIIDDGGSRFTALITCTGNDFYNQNQTEQIRIQSGYEGFIRSMKDEWSFYILTENVDLDGVKDGIRETIAGLEDNLYSASERYKQLKRVYDEAKIENKPVDKDVINEMLRIQKKISGYETRLMEAKVELMYADTFDSPDYKVEKKVMVYAISWRMPMKMPLGEKLEGEALISKANEELDKKVASMIGLLSSASVNARRMRTDEIIELFYAQLHPVTSGQFKLSRYYAMQTGEGEITQTKSVAKKRNEWKSSLADKLLFGEGR